MTEQCPAKLAPPRLPSWKANYVIVQTEDLGNCVESPDILGSYLGWDKVSETVSNTVWYSQQYHVSVQVYKYQVYIIVSVCQMSVCPCNLLFILRWRRTDENQPILSALGPVQRRTDSTEILWRYLLAGPGPGPSTYSVTTQTDPDWLSSILNIRQFREQTKQNTLSRDS